MHTIVCFREASFIVWTHQSCILPDILYVPFVENMRVSAERTVEDDA